MRIINGELENQNTHDKKIKSNNTRIDDERTDNRRIEKEEFETKIKENPINSHLFKLKFL